MMSAIVREVPPTKLCDLWRRRQQLDENIRLTLMRIEKHRACVRENERHLKSLRIEREIIVHGIREMEAKNEQTG